VAPGKPYISDTNPSLFSAKFTEAIAIQPENHILYSNRSAAYASKKEWDNALADADKTTQIKPDWAKGWGRKGAALHGKGDLLGANDAYEEGLKHDANNAQLKSGLASVEKAMQYEATGGAGGEDPAAGLSRMFNDPGLLQKLAANPKTSGYLSDPSFMAKLEQLKKNPQMSPDMFSDPRMIQVLGVMMGVDMDMRDSDPREQQDTNMTDAPSQSRPEPAKKAPEPEPEPEELDEEALEKKKAKEAADKEKALGTESYKKRNFDEAIQYYTKAWETFKDITYLNNLGAAQFEKGDYDACIAACNQAVEEGREIYADFKIIAKSYARIGTAYERKGDLSSAVEHYNKSLTEHRTPDVLNKLRAAEKSKKESERHAYIDPAKAEEAREEGNKKFKESDFPGAVACYSEMVKRAPEDPRGYSNRAAAFIKLFEFPSALEDCDMAIKKDPAFIRAYIRKAQAYFGMRKYSDCVDACGDAQQVDAQHHKSANAREIEQQQQKAFASMYQARDNESEEQTRERLMQDPEVSLHGINTLWDQTRY
jgi:stress-induced-phosphoprotein 1